MKKQFSKLNNDGLIFKDWLRFSRVSQAQLEKTHTDMTKALQPTEQTDKMLVR